jgi:hypothetical protein
VSIEPVPVKPGLGVHVCQGEAPPLSVAWSGSPASFVAPVLSAETESLSPASAVAQA